MSFDTKKGRQTVEVELLENGDFEQGKAHWSTEVGATTGSERSDSVVEWTDEARSGRALHLSGDGRTTRWRSVQSAPIAVEPGATLHLSGWVRAAGLRTEGNQFPNQYLGVIATEGSERTWLPVRAVETRDAPWTALERILVVPEEVTEIRVIAFLSTTGHLWIDDVSLTVTDPIPWGVATSPRFVFHALPSAPIDAEDRAAIERQFSWTEEQLGLTYAGPPIDFYRYPDAAFKGLVTGKTGNAHFDGKAIHTLWSRDSHEMVHLLASQLGDPHGALLGEGLAVALSRSWQGLPTDDWLRRYRQTSDLPGLGALIDRWESVDEQLSYPMAGSFVSSLIQRRGMQAFLELYAAEGRVRERLDRAYRVPLSDLEADWHAGFDRVPGKPPAGLPTAFPELLGARLVRDVAPNASATVFAGDAVRVGGTIVAFDGLAPGSHVVQGASIEVVAPPPIEIEVIDLAPGPTGVRVIRTVDGQPAVDHTASRTLDGLERQPAGDWRWVSRWDSPEATPILRIAIYRLPPGATLGATSRPLLTRTTDERVEAAEITWVPPYGRVRTWLVYDP